MCKIPPHVLDKVVDGLARDMGYGPRIPRPVPRGPVRLVKLGPGGEYTRIIVGDTRTGKITIKHTR